MAVIERAIVDAVGGPSVPDHFQRHALRQIRLGPAMRNNGLWWWLTLLFDDPAGTLRHIQQAFETGEVWRVAAAHRCGRSAHRVGRGGWRKLGACREKSGAYDAN